MSFLRAVEVWIPQGVHLLRSSAARVGPDAPLELTAAPLLRRGEGPAGAAFASGRAQLFAAEAGSHLDTLLALPFFAGSSLLAVVVLGCGGSPDEAGCIELWQPNQLRELVHAGGYYGAFGAFERLSQVMRFQRGSGLPGITWRDGMPQLTRDLGSSSSFLRASAAREMGIRSALSLPLYRSGSVGSLALWLSVRDVPLARAVEIWQPDAQQRLHISEALYEPTLSSFGDDNRCVEFGPGAGLVGKVFDTGLPLAVEQRAREPFSGHVGAADAGLSLALGLPIHDGRRVRAVVALLA